MSVEAAADPFEAEKMRDSTKTAAAVCRAIGALLGIAGLVGAGVLFWSAWAEDFDLWGPRFSDRWDWWRGAGALAAGLFAFGVLHGLAGVLSWLSWRADEALPVSSFRDSDVWTGTGPAPGQGM